MTETFSLQVYNSLNFLYRKNVELVNKLILNYRNTVTELQGKLTN